MLRNYLSRALHLNRLRLGNIDYFKNSAQMDDRPFSASANQGLMADMILDHLRKSGSIKILPALRMALNLVYKVPTNSLGPRLKVIANQVSMI